MAKDTQDNFEGLKRKNAELLGEVKELKARLATLEGERDAARDEAAAAGDTVRRILLDEPLEREFGPRFLLPWRVMRPLVEEHFDLALGSNGKPEVKTKDGELVPLDGIVGKMCQIPDLAVAIIPPRGGGATGNDGEKKVPPRSEKAAKVAPSLGLR